MKTWGGTRLIGAVAWFGLGATLCAVAFLWDDKGGSAFGTEPGFWWKLGDVALLYAAIPQTLFLIAYARSPWYREAIGRALMLKGFALAMLLDWAAAYRIFGVGWLTADIARCVLFSLVAIGCTYQFVAVGNIQRSARANGGSHGHPMAARDAENDPGSARRRDDETTQAGPES